DNRKRASKLQRELHRKWRASRKALLATLKMRRSSVGDQSPSEPGARSRSEPTLRPLLDLMRRPTAPRTRYTRCKAYNDQTTQEGTIIMAFTAMISELYDAFRRRVGGDEAAAMAAAKATGIADVRFHSIDGKLDALSQTMDQRFEALSQHNQPLD